MVPRWHLDGTRRCEGNLSGLPQSLPAGSVQPRRLSRDAAVRCARGAMPRPRAPSSCRSGHSLIHPERPLTPMPKRSQPHPSPSGTRGQIRSVGRVGGRRSLTRVPGSMRQVGIQSRAVCAKPRNEPSLHCEALESTAWGVLHALRAGGGGSLVCLKM